MVVLAFSLVMPIKVSAVSSIAYSAGNVTGEVEDVITLPGITIGGDDPTVPINLSVDGNGILSMTTTTGLTFTGSSTGSNLAFEGSISDLNNALATLQYRTLDAGTVTLTATLSSPGQVYFPGNGHMYEIVNNGSGISWNDAKIAAEALTKNGASGYLATVTSQAEFDYISPRLSGAGWFGASDAATENDWQWATGPEAGTSFWAGLGDGSPVGGLFSNWSGGEPNDSGGDEDCAEFYAGGSGWNDLPCNGPYLDYYVVEYGAPGDLPVAPESIDFEITTTEPTPQAVPIDSCLDVLDISSNQSDHRYNNISLSNNIDCTGETLSPLFDYDDPDFGVIGFRGNFDGNGYTISNYTLSNPSDYNVGFFAATNGANLSDLIFDTGTITGDYCVGSIVGSAQDTTINNVHSNMDVNGNYSTGGLVGCFEANNADSSLTNSVYNGNIVADNGVGGIIGELDSNLDNTFNVTGNEFNGSISINSYGYYIGGIIGEADADDESSIVVSGNSTVGISIADADTLGGVFGDADADEGATIDIFENTISGDFEGEYNVGSVVGSAEATEGSVIDIHDMTINNNVIGYERVGGIAGDIYTEGYNDNDGTAINLYSLAVNGNVNGGYGLGGIIGEASTDSNTDVITIVDSFVEGDVTGDNSNVGGLVGDSEGLEIESSYYNGNVSNTGNGNDTGGLVGYSDETTITESSSEGTVTSASGQRVGGLVGRNAYSTISESYSMSDVIAANSSRVGGLVGANGEEGIIEDSYARGDVTGDNNVGALVGRCGGEIYRSYATGSVTGGSDTGGLLGYEDGCDNTDSFWDAQTTGQSSSEAGTSKSTVEMKSYSTFTNDSSAGLDNPWDFDNTWGINSLVNNGYPCLLWQDGDCYFDNEDSDGISNVVEAAAPNSGDANDDGTPDNEQPNVASFVNDMTNEYVSLEAPDGCELTSAAIQAETSNTTADSGFDYSSGLVNFTADCGTPGYTADIKIFVYGIGDESLVLRKHKPNTNAYFTITSATVDKAVVDGKDAMVVSYQIVDGQELDIDGLENGTIVDPVGLAKAVVGAPNTGLGGLR